jgi:1,2-diacylglycerol 3-alpha-glucosyltransferase
VVGDGPERKEIEERAISHDKNNNIIFTGKVDREKVNEYYQLADIFVSASTSETQGLTYIEALANGLPLLCRNDECLKDVIADGMNGYKYENFDEFLEYLKRLDFNGNIDEKYKKSARDTAENFSTEKFVENVEKVYCQAIQEKQTKEK